MNRILYTLIVFTCFSFLTSSRIVCILHFFNFMRSFFENHILHEKFISINNYSTRACWIWDGRDLTKQRRLRRRQRQRQRQRQRKKAIGLVSKTTTLHVHITLFCTFLSCPCTTTTWNDQILSFFEDGKGRAINSTVSDWTRAWPSLFSSNINSLLLTKRATLDNREMAWQDTESIFQERFHGRRRLRIVRSIANEALSARLALVISSTSGIILLLKTPTKSWWISPTLFC